MTNDNAISTHQNGEARLDFIGIGCRRCASSWLHRCLNEHPEIGKPPTGLSYFSNQMDKGMDWYLDQFHDCLDKPRIGEFSVSYTYPDKCVRVAEEIYRSFSHVKLFMAVRNPIDRAYSDFRRSVQLLEIPGDTAFREAIEQYSVLLERGCYATFLKNYMQFFPREQIKVLFYEDLSADPGAYLRSLFRFISVDPDFEPSVLSKPSGRAAMIRSETASRMLFCGRDMSKRALNLLHMGFVVKAVRATGVWKWMVELNAKEQELDREDRLMVREYYEDEIKEFEELTGRDLSSWV